MQPWRKPISLVGVVLFVLPWLWVLSSPPLRDLFVKQITGNTGVAPGPPWAGWLSYPFGSATSSDETAKYAALGAQYPGDPQVQAKIADSQSGDPSYGRPDFGRMHAYARLSKQFPRNTWLKAVYLSYAIRSFHDERLGGAFSSTTPLSLYGPAPESTGKAPNFTPQQLNEAIATARQGQQLEPDNAYFGLCEGVLLWMGHHDAEALGALHRASLRPHYDDHTSDDIAAPIAVARKLYGPLLWEQQVTMQNFGAHPIYAQLREKARQWSWYAWKLERTGHHHEAIMVRADGGRLSARMMHGRNSVMNGLVAVAIQALMWAGNPNRRVRNNQLSPGMVRNMGRNPAFLSQIIAQRFAAYARAHGAPGIAAETLRLGTETRAFRMAVTKLINSPTGSWWNLPQPLLYRLRGFWWLACGLLTYGGLCLVAWLCTSALLIRAGGEQPSMRFIVVSASSCIGVTALLTLLARGAIVLDHYISYIFLSWSGALPGMLLLELLAGIGAMLAPCGIAALACGLPAWLNMRGARRAQVQREGRSQLPRDMRPLVWGFFAWSAVFTSLVGWGVAAFAWADQPSGALFQIPILALPFSGEALAPVSAIIATLSGAFWFFGWLLKWRFFMRGEERPLAHSALRRFRAVLGVLLILSSWAYAFTLQASLKPRREADHDFDLFLQRGEIGTIEAQASAKGNHAP